MKEHKRLWLQRSWGQTGSRVQRQIFCSLLVLGVMALQTAQAAVVNAPHWEIKGDLSEACTCQVPCGCNFHSGPSPHHYCWSLAAFDIQNGHYGKVKLGGLHLVRAHGAKSVVWYIDDRATPQQAVALRAIAARISGDAGRARSHLHFAHASITQTAASGGFQIKIGDKGGFEARELIGGDGKNPIVVENMTAWNVRHDIKGETKWLRYKDGFGNQFDLTHTNANQGKFDWTDKTSNYF